MDRIEIGAVMVSSAWSATMTALASLAVDGRA